MIRVGESRSLTRSYTRDDLTAFRNLAELDDDSIASVPEPLIGALFSYLLGVELPGPGTNYLKQEMHFYLPVPLGTLLTASVEITRLRPEKHLVDLATCCTGPGGVVYCDGRALVRVRDVAEPNP